MTICTALNVDMTVIISAAYNAMLITDDGNWTA